MSGSPHVFSDPSLHPEWIQPHSDTWYERLAIQTDVYQYPWKSEFEEPTAETRFRDRIESFLDGRTRVLDVGCGHGAFTAQFGEVAGEVVGIDKRESFIHTANAVNTWPNVRFLTVDVDKGLPFPDHSFDVIYTKKGPWVCGRGGEGNRVIQPGGMVLGLYHGGTDGGLRSLFPGLFQPGNGNPIEEGVRRWQFDLKAQGLTAVDVQGIEEIEYLSTPEDVLIKKCFGQSEAVKAYVWETCLNGVTEVFYKNATRKGLRVVNYHFMVTARVD